MRYAILAAGEGSRLKHEGITVPKPLVRLGEETLIQRLIRIFMDNDATDIMVICNDIYPEVNDCLLEIERNGISGRHIPLRHIVKTTPSSMHSMYELRNMLRGEPFILTTVDTFFSETLFSDYVKAFASTSADGMMAVTDFIDDEKPLYVLTHPHDDQTETTMTESIVNFLDSDDDHRCRYISAGIYGLNNSAIDVLERCIEGGQSRMRNFQRALISSGLHLEAYPLGHVTDIDHASDIPLTVAAVYRAACFSPNMQDKDRAIMDRVLSSLAAKGFYTRAVSEEQLVSDGRLPAADFYLSMARDNAALTILESVASRCMNSADAVRRCTARSYVKDVASRPPCWVKRTDTCAETDNDVVFCATDADYAAVMSDFRNRGIASYVAQRHYDGDIVKFYGVCDTAFFHTFYPSESGHVKFPSRRMVAPQRHYAFDLQKLHNMANAVAVQTKTDIYGGDAVITAEGGIHIIDFNDWPSFSICRDAAAQAITSLVIKRLSTNSSKPRVKGYILDYGATLDTHGEHWSKVIWRGYQREQVPIAWEEYWEAYKLTERRLGKGDIIAPTYTFRHTLEVKIRMQMTFLAQSGVYSISSSEADALCHRIVDGIYAETLAVTKESRGRLERLRNAGIPMVLVSNFYGNMETVLNEFGLSGFFVSVIESAKAGYRKPDVRLWQLGIDALKTVCPDADNSEFVVVGDTMEKDIEPARQLGCATFHVTPDDYDFLRNADWLSR